VTKITCRLNSDSSESRLQVPGVLVKFSKTLDELIVAGWTVHERPHFRKDIS
jgi:hypothetical protein